MKSPIIPRNPSNIPGTLSILLGRLASEALEAHGEHFLIQATRSLDPEHAGRFVMVALPLPRQTLDAATRVALGKLVATKPRKAATATTGTNTTPPPA
jgi:hypothetical protein